MRKWISERKLIWMSSLLVGLCVGLSINFYELSRVAEAEVKTETFYPIKRSDPGSDDFSYWRGRVDSKLESIDKKLDEFCGQIEKLNINLTEVRVRRLHSDPAERRIFVQLRGGHSDEFCHVDRLSLILKKEKKNV